MRKILFLSFIAAILFSTPSYGQRNRVRDADYFPRSEIYIQYGTPTILELVTMLKAPSFFEQDTRNHIFSGVGGLGYNFSIDDRFAVGIYAGASYSKADICDITDEKNVKPLYGKGVMSYVGQLYAGWTFYNEGPIQLSSGVYLGVAYWDEDYTIYEEKGSEKYPHASDQFKVAYHLTACKFRYGDTFGFFAEVGFGFRGLVNAGLSIQL